MRKNTGSKRKRNLKGNIIRVLDIAENEYKLGNINFNYLDSLREDSDSLKILKNETDLLVRFHQLYQTFVVAAAQQLMNASRFLFISIPTREFLEKNKKKQTAINKFEEFNCYVTNLIFYQILLQKDSYVKRIILIEKWTLILNECMKHHDYNMAVAILSALNSASISRLSSGISEETKKMMDQVDGFITSAASQNELRKNLFKNSAIPFLGFYQNQLEKLRDMLMLNNDSDEKEKELENKENKDNGIVMQIAALQYCNRMLAFHNSKSFTGINEEMYVYDKDALQAKQEFFEKYKSILYPDNKERSLKENSLLASRTGYIEVSNDSFRDISYEIQAVPPSKFVPLIGDSKLLIMLRKVNKKAALALEAVKPDSESTQMDNCFEALIDNLYKLFTYAHTPPSETETRLIDGAIKEKLKLLLNALPKYILLEEKRDFLQAEINNIKSEFKSEQGHEGIKLLLRFYHFLDFTLKIQPKKTQALLKKTSHNKDLIHAKTDSKLIEDRRETIANEIRPDSFFKSKKGNKSRLRRSLSSTSKINPDSIDSHNNEFNKKNSNKITRL